MGFNPTLTAKVLQENGFFLDRTIYQHNATFLLRRFGRATVVVSVYPWFFTASILRPCPGGQVVDVHLSDQDLTALDSKMAEWGLFL